MKDMRRIKNTDILRSLAIILILLNHYLGLISQNHVSKAHFIAVIQQMGGDLGVTLFFFMSGFGIFCSLYSMDEKGKLSFKIHMKKRLSRILPEYYVALAGTLAIILIAGVGQKPTIPDVISHIFLVHNCFRSTVQSVSGPLWTMGTIFQFYLIAVVLYKGIKKWNNAFVLGSIGLTIFFKYEALHIVASKMDKADLFLYFWATRNLLTSVLDEFVIGMGIAFILAKMQEKGNSLKLWQIVIGLFMPLTCIWCLLEMGLKYGLGTNTILGYTFHALLALLYGVLLIALSQINMPEKGLITRFLNWMAGYEYGIYLWHYILAQLILEKASIIRQLSSSNYFLGHILLFIITIIWSVIVTKLINYGKAKINMA